MEGLRTKTIRHLSIEDGHMLHDDVWNIDVPHFIFTPGKINMEPKIRPIGKGKTSTHQRVLGSASSVLFMGHLHSIIHSPSYPPYY